jgi:transcriptional regulator with XRE-family HTH domain
MTDVFRKAIAESGVSLYRIAKDTGVSPQSLLRFERGDQSLRLDKADLLAEYLGLRLVRDPDARPPKPAPENLARPMLARRKPKRKAK